MALDSAFSLLTTTEAGESVTVENTVGLPIVYRCLTLLSTVVASSPLNTYREEDQQPIRVPVLNKYHSWIGPDGTTKYPMYTPYELWDLSVWHYNTWGNIFIRKIRNAADSIVDLRPIYPGRVKVEIDPKTKEKIFVIKRMDRYGNIDPVNPEILTTFELMHIPGPGYDGLMGLSPIQAAMQTFGVAKAADKLAAKYLGTGTQLSGVIKVKAPLSSQAQAEGIRSRWMSKHGGAGQAGGVAVLDAETDFMPLTIPPDQLQFLQSRRWQTTEIARMFGIPPHLVGDVEKSTSWGTGIEQQNIGFVAYTVRGITERIAQRVTREIVNTRGSYAAFDLDHLMRGSLQERFQAYQIACGGPWMSRNEIRGMEKQLPMKNPEYDELLPPQGIAPLEDASDSASNSGGAPNGETDEESQDSRAS